MPLKLVRTCYACPEQYDVYDDDRTQVGYLRLRHGEFTAEVPDACGQVVFEGHPEGDGSFMPDERHAYLTCACIAILASLGKRADTPLYEVVLEAPEHHA